MAKDSRHSAPIAVADQTAAPLKRIILGAGPQDRGLREDFIQDLVHRYPDVIPMRDIEPAYTPLRAVCREMETSAGFVDNFWVTPEAGLVIGECKLAGNPEGRREVLAQILDYAAAISKWNYDQLEKAAAKARQEPDFSLWRLASSGSPDDLTENEFRDAIERRLRASQMLLLVIGDAIRPSAEALASFLQLHAGSAVFLALVELSLWENVDGNLLVVPRIPMKTEIAVRGIVRIDVDGHATVTAPPEQRHTASEAEFYDQMAIRRPDAPDALRQFVAELAGVGVTPEYRKSLVLRTRPSPDIAASAGYIDASGSVWLGDSLGSARRVGQAAIGETYLTAIAKATNGAVQLGSYPTVKGPSGKTVTLSDLMPVKDAWLNALRAFVDGLKAAARSNEDELPLRHAYLRP